MTELPFLVVSDCAYWSRDAKTKWEDCGGRGGVGGVGGGRTTTIVLESKEEMMQGLVGNQQ